MRREHRIGVRWVLSVVLVLIGLLCAIGSAQAVAFIEDGQLAEGEVIDDDLFIGGQTVVVNGTVNGDLLAFGGDVTVNGTVKGSLVTSAQNVTINGDIMGSVYGAGYVLELGPSATIGRNAYFGAFSVQSRPGSTVARDLLVGAYQALLAGEVGRDLTAGLGALELSGKIGGDVKLEVGAPDQASPGPSYFGPPGGPTMIAPGLRVAQGARIGGALRYTSPSEQPGTIKETPAGGVIFTRSAHDEDTRPGGTSGLVWLIGRWILRRLRELTTLLLLGAATLWLLPAPFAASVGRARAKPWPAVGWGLIALFGGYAVAAVVAGVTLVLGAALGLITFGGLARTVLGLGFSTLSLALTLFLLLVSYGSKLVSAFLVGALILKGIAPQHADRKGWSLVLGVSLYVFLRAIPVLGWLVGLAATLMGLGAIWLFLRDRYAPTGADPEPRPVED